MDFIEPPIPYDNWFMFAYGNFCMKNNLNYFKKNAILEETEILKYRTDTDSLWSSALSKYKYYKDLGFCISHTVVDLHGQTQVLNIWIRNRTNLVDVYEFVSKHKLVISWEALCVFIKDCSEIYEKRIPEFQ